MTQRPLYLFQSGNQTPISLSCCEPSYFQLFQCRHNWMFLRRAEDIYVLMATKTGLLIPTVMISNPNECFWCKTFPAVFPVWFEGLNVSAVIQVLSEASGCNFHLLLLLINHISSSRVQLPPGFLINHLHYETFITSTWQMRTVEDICHLAEPATAYRLLLFINSLHL